MQALSYGEYSKAIVLRKQIKSGENGAWGTAFEIYDDPTLDYDAPSGIYTAVIFPDDYSQPIYETFPYLNLKNKLLVCFLRFQFSNYNPCYPLFHHL